MRQEESRMQQACVKWFRYQYPNIIITSFPNQGVRSRANASRMKAEGLTAGLPDLLICKDRTVFDVGAGSWSCVSHGLFIEFKTEKGVLSKAQKEVHEKLKNANYAVYVVRSVDEFIDIVTKYTTP